MKSIVAVSGLVLAALLVVSGCRSGESGKMSRQEKVQQEQAAIKAAIPADSLLAKVDFGMSEGEVGAILGPPSSTDSHTTGKQFIPFNFAAKDTMRTVYYYKGVGRVEFSFGSWGQRNGVVMMYADKDEPGYRR